jgi:hypothetical protein
MQNGMSKTEKKNNTNVVADRSWSMKVGVLRLLYSKSGQ